MTVPAGYVRAMGSELGNLWHELQSDFAWLERKWMEFGELFQRGQSRIDMLNAAASDFFYFLNKLAVIPSAIRRAGRRPSAERTEST